jgi:Uma2 family endonuclease
VDGERLLRLPPSARHETICQRLHSTVANELITVTTARLLSARSMVQLTAGTLVRPDLALVTSATGKIWLIAEIISSDDHKPDTVIKKMVYEELNLPRLWMIDPRYNNVEIYHGTPYGMSLKHILGGRDVITEALLPGLGLTVEELFRVQD